MIQTQTLQFLRRHHMYEAIHQQENSQLIPQTQAIGDDLKAELLKDVTPTDKFLMEYLTALNQKKFSYQEFSLEELSKDHSSYSYCPFEACGEEYLKMGQKTFFDSYGVSDEDVTTLEASFYLFGDVDEYDCENYEEIVSDLEYMLDSIELFSGEPLPVNLKFNQALSQVLIHSRFRSDDLPLAGSAYRIDLDEEKCLFLFKLKSGEAAHYELYLQEETPLKLESSCFEGYDYRKSMKPICSSDNPHVSQLLADLYFKLYKSKRKPELSQGLMDELTHSLKYL